MYYCIEVFLIFLLIITIIIIKPVIMVTTPVLHNPPHECLCANSEQLDQPHLEIQEYHNSPLITGVCIGVSEQCTAAAPFYALRMQVRNLVL